MKAIFMHYLLKKVKKFLNKKLILSYNTHFNKAVLLIKLKIKLNIIKILKVKMHHLKKRL